MGLFRKKKSKKVEDQIKGQELFAEEQENKLPEESDVDEAKEKALEEKNTSFLKGMRSLDKKKINLNDAKECIEYVDEQCNQINAVKNQLMESKIEYGAVTSYLTDIQKIDVAQEAQKKEVVDAAKRIVNLTGERNRYQNREIKISDIMYKHIEKYEDNFPDEIKKMKQNEEYEELIKGDMRQLEGEKAVLKYHKEEYLDKKKYIQSIAIVTGALLLGIFVFLYIFQTYAQADVQIPFLAAVAVGMAGILMLFLENNKNNQAIVLNERKINRAIGLMNTVKIKYVNNRNNLDYCYQKYRVHASKELEYLWDQYMKAKEENRRYQQNTELMQHYSNVLIDALDGLGLSDSEVWIYQPIALYDDKEMVEVRHRLNSRRQKLRDQIDYNNGIILNAQKEIGMVAWKKPDMIYTIQKKLVEYKIDLNLEDPEAMIES